MPNDVAADLERPVKFDRDRLILLVGKPCLRGGSVVRSQETV